MRTWKRIHLIWIGLIALAIGAQSSFGFDANEDWVRELAGLNFTVRCENWIGGDRIACMQLSYAMVRSLDFDANPERKALAFFKSRLGAYSRDDGILSLLRKFDYELQMLAQSLRTSVDLYKIAYEYFKTEKPGLDPDRATHEFFAVIFQDNARRYHLTWMKENASKVSPRFTQALDRLLSRLGDEETNAKFFDRVKLFPDEIEAERSHFNRKLYYYYMPWMLSRSLEKTSFRLVGHDEKRLSEYLRLSRVLPLMMSVIYKYHHYYKNESGSLIMTGWKTFMKKPEPNGTSDPAWTYRYRDLYMAYLGSVNATPGDPLQVEFDYRNFENRIGTEPVATLKAIYEVVK